jgi:hypothetical protein
VQQVTAYGPASCPAIGLGRVQVHRPALLAGSHGGVELSNCVACCGRIDRGARVLRRGGVGHRAGVVRRGAERSYEVIAASAGEGSRADEHA